MLLLHAARPVNEEDLAPLIERFSIILCLHHWRVIHRLEDDKAMGDSLMRITPNRDRNIATMYIRRSLIGRPTSEIGPLLLHELMHLVLEPIVEEHTLQLQYEVSETRLKEYQKRFLRPLERAVQHLTNQIAPLIALNELAAFQESIAEMNGKDSLKAVQELLLTNQQILQTIKSTIERLNEE